MTARKSRKPLQEMTPEERARWLAHREAALSSFVEEVIAPYLEKRRRRGTRTDTDVKYEAFLPEAANLIEGLRELRAMFEAQSQGDQGAQP